MSLPTPRGRRFATAAVMTAAAGLAPILPAAAQAPTPGIPRVTVVPAVVASPDQGFDQLTQEQKDNAKVIIDVAAADPSLVGKGQIIAIATALQESKLINLPQGDRDSVGVFQQRPSMGWCGPAQTPDACMDVADAAKSFYGLPGRVAQNNGLLQVSNWQSMSVTEAAQTVQKSAYPDAYAQWEPLATKIVEQLGGNGPTQPTQPPQPTQTPKPSDPPKPSETPKPEPSKPAVRSELKPNEHLNRGEAIESPSQQLKLAMLDNGDLVLTRNGQQLWDSGTYGVGHHAIMQPDGNLVILDSAGRRVWQSGTAGFYGALLRLQDDGTLVVVKGEQVLWANGESKVLENGLLPGQQLDPGQSVSSPNGQFKLTMKDNGELTLTLWGATHWTSRTKGTGHHALMQADGNLVVLNAAGAPVWATGTNGFYGAQLQVHDSGALTVTKGTRLLWNRMGLHIKRTELVGGQRLDPGQHAISPNRLYALTLSTDGKVLLTRSGQPVWEPKLSGKATHLDLLENGNLVAFDEAGNPVWQSWTAGHTGATLKVTDDGNVVLLDAKGKQYWDRNVYRPEPAPTQPPAPSETPKPTQPPSETPKPTQPPKQSEVGGQISRQEVLDRAKFWADQGLPYSMGENDTAPDPQGKPYRRDCSGMVSMALHLEQAYGTVNLEQFLVKISKDELKPGDVIGKIGPGTQLDKGHVMIFVKWNDESKTTFTAYEESGAANKSRTWDQYEFGSDWFLKDAYRYKNIVD